MSIVKVEKIVQWVRSWLWKHGDLNLVPKTQITKSGHGTVCFSCQGQESADKQILGLTGQLNWLQQKAPGPNLLKNTDEHILRDNTGG